MDFQFNLYRDAGKMILTLAEDKKSRYSCFRYKSAAGLNNYLDNPRSLLN
jgi:hypothetical protein